MVGPPAPRHGRVSTARSDWMRVPWSPPRLSLAGEAMASGFVAGTARGPGAGIGQGANRAAKDRFNCLCIPHVPASTRIPVLIRTAFSHVDRPPGQTCPWALPLRTQLGVSVTVRALSASAVKGASNVVVGRYARHGHDIIRACERAVKHVHRAACLHERASWQNDQGGPPAA